MPTTTDLNVSPWFDDFDESKRYHRILFRPAVPVQARELTQMQTILQNQIERFGNHVFKNGAVVDGCSISDINPLPYVRLADQYANGAGFSAAGMANLQVVSATSNLTARIIISQAGSTLTYPDTNIFFINYVNTGNNGAAVFANNETLNVYKIPRTGNNAVDLVATVNTFTSNSQTTTIGSAHGIGVSDGIIYQNGFFIKVDAMVGLVNAHSTDAGNTYVGFTTVETIVNFDQDPSLLDNALGYSNESAPGAFRLKLTPQLVALTEAQAASANNFNPIATYNYGSLIENNSTDPYSVLDEKMSQRFNELSGNFVVKPFVVDTIKHASNSQLLEARVSPGKGYALGRPVELLQTAYVDIRRGIDKASADSQQITANFGQYVVLNQVSGSFDLTTWASVDLYDTVQNAASNHNWSGLTPSGTKIGTAQVRGYEIATGLPGNAASQYNLYLFNIQMNSGKNFNQVKSVYSATAPKGVGDVISNGLINASNKKLVWSFGRTGLYSLRDANNNLTTEYTFRTKASSTLATDGSIALTITTSAPGGTNIFPYGIGQLDDGNAQDFLVVLNSAVASNSLTGTVTPSTSSTTVTGSGTAFLSTFNVGDIIQVGTDRRYVMAIASDTSLTVDAVFTTSTSGQSFQKYFPAGYVFPISQSLLGNRRVQITDSTHATIYTGCLPSTATGVTVYYNVLRTNVTPAKKVVRKNRFVKIDTTSNKRGPWCLGLSDVVKLRGVYANSSASYGVSGVDKTNQFVFDSGQRDTHYGLAYLYPDSGTDVSSTPYLTVEVDYLTPNTTPGVGFFTVESYPIDDSNAANTAAITTAEIPLYISESGERLPLRDYVDFRPVATNTATDSGAIDRANTAQIATAVSSASLNPSNTVTLSIPAQGSHIPAPGKNFQSDITYYLPRKDLFYFSPSGQLKVKEGAAKENPQAPLYPDNGMAVAVLSIPPYPSLSLDQVETLKQINDYSKSVIADTSNPTKVSLVTNRRYTMRDIGVLDQRITTLEYYMSLSLLEKQASEMQVADENGLDRFKNGIFVNPFDSHGLGDVSNIEYRIAIDERKGVARPFIEREQIDMGYNALQSSGVQKTGRLITLPYTQVTYSTQPYATKYRNAAPAAFKWNGSAYLFPSYDNNIDTVNTGAVQVTIDNASAWQEFAASPFGTMYGDWQSTTSSETVVTNDGVQNLIVKQVQLNQAIYNNPQAWGGAGQDLDYWIAVAAREQGVKLDNGWVLGDVIVDEQAQPRRR